MTLRQMLNNKNIKKIDLLTSAGYVQCSINDIKTNQVKGHLGCSETEHDIDVSEFIDTELTNPKISNDTLYAIA